MSTTDLFGDPIPAPSPLIPSEKRWLPEFLLDEVIPELRAKPEDWLITGVDHDFWITDDQDEDGPGLRLLPGETASFQWFRSFGTVTFTVHPDGTYSSAVPLPPEANHFADVDDVETMMDTPQDFARAWAEMVFDGDEAAESLEVEVNVYQWSDPVTFRLIICADGKPSFEEVSHD